MLIAKDIAEVVPDSARTAADSDGISLTLHRGDAVAIMGPSGSGKSTLLYILGALEPPTAGTVTLDGANPFELGERAQAAFRNQHIGFVFQDHSLLPQCSVLENVLTPTLAAPPSPRPSRPRTSVARASCSTQVGLGDRLDHRPAELSGGEKQRAALARALILQPVAAPVRRADRQPRSHVGRQRSPSCCSTSTPRADHSRHRDAQRRAGGAISDALRDGWREAEIGLRDCGPGSSRIAGSRIPDPGSRIAAPLRLYCGDTCSSHLAKHAPPLAHQPGRRCRRRGGGVGALRRVARRRLGPRKPARYGGLAARPRRHGVCLEPVFFATRSRTTFGTSDAGVSTTPLIVANGFVTHEPSGRRAAGVLVYGVDERFWAFHGQRNRSGVLLSPALTSELGAASGDPVLLRLQKPSAIPDRIAVRPQGRRRRAQCD